MKPPTVMELRTTIHVLQMLERRIDNDAADSVMRLPDSRFGDQHAACIEECWSKQNEFRTWWRNWKAGVTS